MAHSGGPSKGRGHDTSGAHGSHGGKHRKKFSKAGKKHGSEKKNPHTKQPKKGTRGMNMKRKGGKVPG